jgi:activator of 2-hydroxyglutaryl-CoA dehydratase
MDVGSTTVKAVLVDNDRIAWQDYQRHHTRQAEKSHIADDRSVERACSRLGCSLIRTRDRGKAIAKHEKIGQVTTVWCVLGGK